MENGQFSQNNHNLEKSIKTRFENNNEEEGFLTIQLISDKEPNHSSSNSDQNKKHDSKSCQMINSIFTCPDWIDIRSRNDPKSVSSIAKYFYNQSLEDEIQLSSATFNHIQNSISYKTRDSAIKWLIQVNDHLKLSIDGLFSAILYLDIFLQRSHIELSQVRLLTVGCFCIAQKIEGHTKSLLPHINELSNLCFTNQDIFQIEIRITHILQYILNYPTIPYFLRRYLCAADASEEETETAFCIAKLCIQNFIFIDYKGSELATVIVFLTCAAYSNILGSKQAVLISRFDDVPKFIKLSRMIQNYILTLLEENQKIFSNHFNFNFNVQLLCT